MYKLFLAVALFFVEPVIAEKLQRVDILSNFSPKDIPVKYTSVQQAGYRLLNLELGDLDYYIANYYQPEVKKIIIMNGFPTTNQLLKLPKEKLVLFEWEPPGPKTRSYTDLFSRVYTWNDDIVDGIKFFKFQYPFLQPICENRPSFDEKKLCVMVSGRLMHERKKIIQFFSTKPDGVFEFYGNQTGDPTCDRMYRGKITGTHSGSAKINVIKQYRFCVCIENTFDCKGYITEKIFSGFAAGCVPIYWGPSNVGDYIPKDCFIDCRDFENYDQLYEFIKEMSEETYNQYVECIKAFLKSEKGFQFTGDHYNKVLLDAITN